MTRFQPLAHPAPHLRPSAGGLRAQQGTGGCVGAATTRGRASTWRALEFKSCALLQLLSSAPFCSVRRRKLQDSASTARVEIAGQCQHCPHAAMRKRMRARVTRRLMGACGARDARGAGTLSISSCVSIVDVSVRRSRLSQLAKRKSWDVSGPRLPFYPHPTPVWHKESNGRNPKRRASNEFRK